MQYTLSQICKKLSGRTHGFAGGDVKDAVNDAIQALSGLKGWECLRKVLRFSSVGPCITLPQGSAGLVRVCVNGRPGSIRGQDFRFIQSGPGDLRHPPKGFSKPIGVDNVYDNGKKAVIIEPPAPFRLFAYSDAASQPYITVRGVTPDGKDVSVNVPMTASPVYNETTGALTSGTEPGNATLTETIFQTITDVVLDDCATGYVTLYCADVATDDRYPIALYNPYIKSPKFHQYILPEIKPDQHVEILAEVRMSPMPLVNDTDLVPFEGYEPIEWMIRHEWCMQSGEVDQATKYRESAEKWLQSFEVADDTVQTSVIVNNAFTNSLGEVSLESVNI